MAKKLLYLTYAVLVYLLGIAALAIVFLGSVFFLNNNGYFIPPTVEVVVVAFFTTIWLNIVLAMFNKSLFA